MAILSVEVKDQRNDDKIVDWIKTRYEASKAWRESPQADWEEHYKHYRFYRKESEHHMRSNIYVPYIFAIVESVVPKMLNTVFNASPIMAVQPREGGDENLSWVIERWLEYAFQEDELDLYGTLETFFKESSIYGTSFMKILPRFTGDKVPVLDYIDVEPVDITKIFPDPRATSLKTAEWVIHKDWVEYDKLLEMAEQGFYEKSTVADLEDWFESITKVDEDKLQRLGDIDKDQNYVFDHERKIVEVLEYWDREQIVVVAAQKVILKKEDNPFKGLLPFIMTRYTTVPHEFYGIGIPEMARALQEELNNIRNQINDNVNIIINRMFIANKYADVEFDSLISYPGNVIMADSVDAVKPLDTRDVTKSAYLMQEHLIGDIQNVTGEWEYGRGQPPEKRETATGIIRLQQAANIRFDALVKRIEFGTMRALAKLFVWYAYHFLDHEKMRRIIGEEEFDKRDGMRFFELDPEEVLRSYHFQPMGSSTSAIKELRAQQIINLYQMWNQDPMIHQYNLRQTLAQALDIRTSTKLILTPEEAVEQMQAMQPQQAQPGGGGPPGGGPLPPGGGAPVAGQPPMAMPPGEGPAPQGGAVAPAAVPQEMVGA
jgi:hypothetical protein